MEFQEAYNGWLDHECPAASDKSCLCEYLWVCPGCGKRVEGTGREVDIEGMSGNGECSACRQSPEFRKLGAVDYTALQKSAMSTKTIYVVVGLSTDSGATTLVKAYTSKKTAELSVRNMPIHHYIEYVEEVELD